MNNVLQDSKKLKQIRIFLKLFSKDKSVSLLKKNALMAPIIQNQVNAQSVLKDALLVSNLQENVFRIVHLHVKEEIASLIFA